MRNYPALALRLALGAAFLYAVADRFGWLGGPGSHNVSWGTFARFTSFVGQLNWFVPSSLIAPLAWIETGIETFLGIALILGLWLRPIAIASALLLLAFATTMSIALGAGAPLSSSVFTAAAGAYALAAVARVKVLR
jgi:uncharacterized membrane protein YphA (DoxX/SURF4 family)